MWTSKQPSNKYYYEENYFRGELFSNYISLLSHCCIKWKLCANTKLLVLKVLKSKGLYHQTQVNFIGMHLEQSEQSWQWYKPFDFNIFSTRSFTHENRVDIGQFLGVYHICASLPKHLLMEAQISSSNLKSFLNIFHTLLYEFKEKKIGPISNRSKVCICT